MLPKFVIVLLMSAPQLQLTSRTRMPSPGWVVALKALGRIAVPYCKYCWIWGMGPVRSSLTRFVWSFEGTWYRKGTRSCTRGRDGRWVDIQK